MTLFYTSVGEILYAIFDRDLVSFNHSTNIPLSKFIIDEIDLNKLLYLDLFDIAGKTDIKGLGKYYISGGVLYKRGGWIEFLPPRIAI